MIRRGTDWGEQIGASGHVKRSTIRSNGKGERLMRDRNGSTRRAGRYPDRGYGVSPRVEDVECPSVGRDRHVEGLVAHRDWRKRGVGSGADRRHGVIVLVGDVSHLSIRGYDDGNGSIADWNWRPSGVGRYVYWRHSGIVKVADVQRFTVGGDGGRVGEPSDRDC
jgi:hypothetical protein